MPLFVALAFAAIGLLHASAAAAQERAWSLYQEGTALAEAGDHEGALQRYRAVHAIVEERTLRQANCYGLGMTAQALSETQQTSSLACEGVMWLDCFLEDGAAIDIPSRAAAEAARASLSKRCEEAAQASPVVEPPEEPTRSEPTIVESPAPAVPKPRKSARARRLTIGLSGVAMAGAGTALTVSAFADAREVRKRERENTGALERRAKRKLVGAYALFGLSALTEALLVWRTVADDDNGDARDVELAVGLHWVEARLRW